jgi:hypothetical protein
VTDDLMLQFGGCQSQQNRFVSPGVVPDRSRTIWGCRFIFSPINVSRGELFFMSARIHRFANNRMAHHSDIGNEPSREGR